MEEQNSAVHYHIMTSCDSNLLQYVPIQLYSISIHLKAGIVHFYLFHRNIPDKDLQPLEALCRQLGNIIFYAVAVPEAEKYDVLASHGGGWCAEAYYSLCSHQILPEYVKRVLYIDAGDVIFTGDISPYYHSDFQEKALIVTPTLFKTFDGGIAPYEAANAETPEGFEGVFSGLFNSGSYLINLDKLRDAQLTINDWLDFSQGLCELSGKQDTSHVYFGDQGLLSSAFADDLMLYGYSQAEEVRHMPYIPYNFYIGYYNKINMPPNYHPAIVHFAGGPKPWKLWYPIPLGKFPLGRTPFETLKEEQAQWYDLWYQYALITDQFLKALEC